MYKSVNSTSLPCFFLHFIVLKPNSTVSRSFYKILSGSLSHRIGSWCSRITIVFISSAGCSTYSLLFLLLLWVTMRMYKKRSTAENIVPFLNDYSPLILVIYFSVCFDFSLVFCFVFNNNYIVDNATSFSLAMCVTSFPFRFIRFQH